MSVEEGPDSSVFDYEGDELDYPEGEEDDGPAFETEDKGYRRPGEPLISCLRQILVETAAISVGDTEATEGGCLSCQNPIENVGGISDVPGCPISGGCELSWAHQHPERYLNDEGQPIADKLGCANCAVHLGLSVHNGQLSVKKFGTCQVTKAGKEFRQTGLEQLLDAEVFRPEDGLEEFDGAGSIADNSGQTALVCSGMYLATHSSSQGVSAGVYQCPLSDTTGEHCLQLLFVTPEGHVTGDEGQEWSRDCLLRRSNQPQD